MKKWLIETWNEIKRQWNKPGILNKNRNGTELCDVNPLEFILVVALILIFFVEK